MRIEFNSVKDAVNVRKHAISLSRAADMVVLAVVESDATICDEDRYRAFGHIDGDAYCLVFTMRGDVTRVISLRRAHKKEMERYGA